MSTAGDLLDAPTHECPDCGQAMIITTPSRRCQPCLDEKYRQLRIEWERTHHDYISRQMLRRQR